MDGFRSRVGGDSGHDGMKLRDAAVSKFRDSMADRSIRVGWVVSGKGVKQEPVKEKEEVPEGDGRGIGRRLGRVIERGGRRENP